MDLISVDRPYDGAKAKLGDVVYAKRDKGEGTAPPQKVVYVGRDAFVVESSGGTLTTYNKTTAGRHLFSVERVLVVNGFQVPAPLGEDPGETRTIYAADPTRTEWYFELTRLSALRRALAIERGLAHATSAAAAAHAKAMAGVDPTARKSLDDAYDNLP